MNFTQGDPAVLTLHTRDYTGALTTPDVPPTVTIHDAEDTAVVTDGALVNVSTGVYTYTYVLAEDAPIGLWRATWDVVIDGAQLDDDTYFSVVPSVGAPVPGLTEIEGFDNYYYTGRFSQKQVGMLIHIGGVLADPDGSSVTVTMVNAEGDTVFSRAATRESEGVYSTVLDTTDTSNSGRYSLVWSYEIGGEDQAEMAVLEVGDYAPYYDALDDDMTGIVDQVWWRFGDLFDSPTGGPHLQVYFQGRFGRNRMAQLLHVAVGRLNSVAQPHQSYSIAEPGQFPVEKWGPLLSQALYVEVLKHLVRSYVEQPDWPGVNLAYADRRSYMDRWRSVYDMETEDLRDMLEVFKIANMGLGTAHVLVAGGVYGSYGPVRTGRMATRPRYMGRFY